jgi:hypothetical protein
VVSELSIARAGLSCNRIKHGVRESWVSSYLWLRISWLIEQS